MLKCPQASSHKDPLIRAHLFKGVKQHHGMFHFNMFAECLTARRAWVQTLLSVWVPSGCSGFLPQSNRGHVSIHRFYAYFEILHEKWLMQTAKLQHMNKKKIPYLRMRGLQICWRFFLFTMLKNEKGGSKSRLSVCRETQAGVSVEHHGPVGSAGYEER